MESREGRTSPAGKRLHLSGRRFAVLLAIVTLGVSQPVFGMILANPAPFGTGGPFLLWVVLWVQGLPLALAVGIEEILLRTCGEGRGYRIWKAGLYALLSLSIVRQVQVGSFGSSLPGGPVAGLALLALTAGVVFAASRRWDRPFALYFSILGGVAPGLTFIFAFQMGLFGSAWRGDSSPQAPSDAPPVFVIVFDELSLDVMADDGRIDPERFPHFAALAADSAWFREATTNDYLTSFAVPRMLKGRRDPAAPGDSLFGLVGDRYRVIVSTGMSHLEDVIQGFVGQPDHVKYLGKNHLLDRSPGSVPQILAVGLARSYLLPQPIRGWVLEKGGGWQTIHDVHREHRVILDDLIAEEPLDGTLVYWHTTLPHDPFVLDRHGRPHGRKTGGWDNAAATLEDYVEQVRFADHLLGGIVDALKNRGLYDRSWLIVTSDHGLRTPEVVMDGDDTESPDRLTDLVARVPLLIRGPGIQPGTRDVDYQHVDFTPTILDLLGYDADGNAFEGRSAVSNSPSPRPKTLWDYHGRAYMRDSKDGFWRRAGDN